MHIISHKKLRQFYEKHSKAKLPIEHWYNVAENAEWTYFADVKRDFNSVDAIGNQRFVFNIKGNDYRIVTVIQFAIKRVYIRFVGTHADYDKIDCKTI